MNADNTDKELICGGDSSGGRGRFDGRRRWLWEPKVDVPVKGLLHCRDFLTEECEGRVDGAKNVWRRTKTSEHEISHCWADT